MGERSEDWLGLDMQAGLSLNCTAWRRAREGWMEEARARPKLEVMGRLMDRRCEARCVEVVCKRHEAPEGKLDQQLTVEKYSSKAFVGKTDSTTLTYFLGNHTNIMVHRWSYLQG